ncbi:hypothetical protein Efla_001047 [Eimeria flavescens]
MGVLKVIAFLSVGAVCFLNEEANAVPSTFDGDEEVVGHGAEDSANGSNEDGLSANEGKQVAPAPGQGSPSLRDSRSSEPAGAAGAAATEPSEAAEEEEEEEEGEEESPFTSEALLEEGSIDGYATDDDEDQGEHREDGLLEGEAAESALEEADEDGGEEEAVDREDGLLEGEAAERALEEADEDGGEEEAVEGELAEEEEAGLPEESSAVEDEEEEAVAELLAVGAELLSATSMLTNEGTGEKPPASGLEEAASSEEVDYLKYPVAVLMKILEAASKLSAFISIFEQSLGRPQAELQASKGELAHPAAGSRSLKRGAQLAAAAPAVPVPLDSAEAGRAAALRIALEAESEEEEEAAVAAEYDEDPEGPQGVAARSTQPPAEAVEVADGHALSDKMLPDSEEESDPAGVGSAETAAEETANSDAAEPKQQAEPLETAAGLRGAAAEKRAGAPESRKAEQGKKVGAVRVQADGGANSSVKAANLNRQASGLGCRADEEHVCILLTPPPPAVGLCSCSRLLQRASGGCGVCWLLVFRKNLAADSRAALFLRQQLHLLSNGCGLHALTAGDAHDVDALTEAAPAAMAETETHQEEQASQAQATETAENGENQNFMQSSSGNGAATSNTPDEEAKEQSTAPLSPRKENRRTVVHSLGAENGAAGGTGTTTKAPDGSGAPLPFSPFAAAGVALVCGAAAMLGAF